jgi:thiamine-monophosphate kinase
MSYWSDVGRTVGSLTERDLIARIQQRLPPAPDWLLVGIGDDAAVVETERNRVDVLSVDALVEGVHFDRSFVPPDAIGHRALAVNLSDLAAMGAAPRLALLSLMLPPSLPLDHFDAIVGGLVTLAVRHRTHVVGGNVTRSPGPLIIDVTVTGTVKRRQALTRSGARPGDELYVSGTIGSAAAGLRILRQRAMAQLSTREDTEALIERYLRPEPRVRLGTVLSRNRAASACMDLSDGLSDAVYGIAEASGVGAVIDGDALPIDPAAREVFEADGVDALTAAITGGDDYELVAAVRPRTRRRLAAALRHGGAPIIAIGRCTAERAVLLQRGSREPSLLPRGGYSHFRSPEGSPSR